MNWGRGLFRLWLTLSVLWVVLLGSILVLDEHLLDGKKVYDVEGKSKERYEITAFANVSETDVVAFAQKNQRTDCSQDKTGPWCSYRVKLEMPRKPINLVPVYLAGGVPAAVFFVGGAFYWVLLGFRRNC